MKVAQGYIDYSLVNEANFFFEIDNLAVVLGDVSHVLSSK